MKNLLFSFLFLSISNISFSQSKAFLVDSLFQAGIKQSELNQYEYAIQSFSAVLMLDDWHTEAFYNRGKSYYKINNIDSACKDWRRGYILNDAKSKNAIINYCKGLIIVGSDTVSIADTSFNRLPEFPGGETALIKFLSQNLNHPKKPRGAKSTETVFVTFIVSTTGEIKDVQILKGQIKEFNEEVLRVVNLMPDWKPGFEKGIPIDFQYNLPIRFKY